MSRISKSFSLLFYLKKPKNYKGGELPVYLRIVVNHERTELSLKRSWLPERWNPLCGRAKGTKEDVRTLNSYLDLIQANIYEEQRKHFLNGEELSAAIIKRSILGIEEKGHSLLAVFREHNQKIGQLIGKGYSKATWVKYESTLKHLEGFIEARFGAKDLELKKLTLEFLSHFEHYLRAQKSIGINAASKYIKNVKKIVRECAAHSWIDKDPFAAFKVKHQKVNRSFLSSEEMNVLLQKEFAIDRLEQAKDLFLLSCFTGLSFSDVMALTPANISMGVDHTPWIFTYRKKTNVPSRIPLLPAALSIVEKYKEHPKVCNTGKLLPGISNQKMNAYLKEIGDLCGIHKPMTFHMARHTFATTVTLSNGVPIETVSKMLGHTNLKITQHYARILDTKLSEDIGALRKKLESSNQKRVTGSS